MKKTLLLLLAVILVGSTALGQLSTRENYDWQFQMGTRPQEGDAALHFVFPIIDLSADNGSDAGLYKGNSLISGDMLTFKYYHTDDVVVRAGIRLYADNAHTSGTAVDSTDANPIFEDFELETIEYRSIDRSYALAGGLEKHFTNSNIFDVYAGGELLVGLGKDRSVMNGTYFNGDIDNTIMTTNTTVFGFAGVAGFNVFIAELPIAVGLEYGLGGKWIFNGKTHVERTLEIDATDTNISAEWDQQDFDAFGDPDLNGLGLPRQYSSLSRRYFNMDTNNSVRINILIYFNTDRNDPAPANG